MSMALVEKKGVYGIVGERKATLKRKTDGRKKIVEERKNFAIEERLFKEALRDGIKLEIAQNELAQFSTIKKFAEQHYVGIVLERYLLAYFKNIVEVKTCGRRERKPVDWIFDIENKKIKIKQVCSRFHIHIDDIFIRERTWWKIGYNDIPDVFILSIWPNILRPIPSHVFAIGKHEIIGRQEIWKRYSMFIGNNRVDIGKYSKFLISQDGLGNMQKNFEKRLKEIDEYNIRKGFTKTKMAGII